MNRPNLVVCLALLGPSALAARGQDIALRLLAVANPSAAETTTVLPTALTSVLEGQPYCLELWVSDVGTQNTGVTSAYVDVLWPADLATLGAVNHGTVYTTFASGTVDNTAGRVDELGGSTLNVAAVQPQWVRAAFLLATADAPGLCTYTLAPSGTGVAALGRGAIPWSEVSLQHAAAPHDPDCNGNAVADGADISAGTSLDCNLNAVPDECDLADGSSPDANGNNRPDECEPCTTPTWQKRTAADGAGSDELGRSVALAGTRLLGGAPKDDDRGSDAGAAYVYRLDGSAWVLESKLLAADGSNFDAFGTAVATDGDVAVIGAPLDDPLGTNSGAVYVFTRSGTTWSQAARLFPADGASNDRFGISVALDAGTIVIGANGDDDRGSDAGAAYVYVGGGSQWAQQAKLLASDGGASDNFGLAVVLLDDTALVGADGDDDRGSGAGAAYVFQRSGTSWSQQAKLLASDGAAADGLGGSVALGVDTAVLGAPGRDEGGAEAGAAYVFARQGAAWTQQVKLLAAARTAGDRTGAAVALAGELLLAGAPAADWAGPGAGGATLFLRSGAAWSEAGKLTPGDPGAGDDCGLSVALADGLAALGAWADDDRGTNAGAVHTFRSIADCNANTVLDACDLAAGLAADGDANGIPDDCEALVGDLNCDGTVSFGDINPFVLALTSLPQYQAAFPGCPPENADANQDGVLNFGDINAFIALLTN